MTGIVANAADLDINAAGFLAADKCWQHYHGLCANAPGFGWEGVENETFVFSVAGAVDTGENMVFTPCDFLIAGKDLESGR